MASLTRRELILGSTGTLALVVLAGCSSAPPSPSPSASPTATGPAPITDALPRLTLTPLHGTDALGVESNVVDIVGDTLVLRDDSPSTVATGGLLAVVARTGERLWSLADVQARLDAEAPRLHPSASIRIAASASRGIVLVETYIDPCSFHASCVPVDEADEDEGYGVAALEVATGTMRWHVRLTPEAYPIGAGIVEADEDRCFVNVGHMVAYGIPDAAPTDDEAGVVALTIADGAVAWERPGIVATDLADVLLGLERVDDVDLVVALDPATGETRWHGEPEERVTTVGRSMVTLASSSRARIVDAATGATVVAASEVYAEFGEDSTGREMTAWIAREDVEGERISRLWTFVDGEARPGANAVEDVEAGLAGIAGGYVWLRTSPYGSSAAFDLGGSMRSDPVEGERLIASADGLVVLQRSGRATVYAVA